MSFEMRPQLSSSTNAQNLQRRSEAFMACKKCGSVRQKALNAEMNLHFPGIEGLDKPTVWVFPEVVVCLNCGFAEFSIQKPELRRIEEGSAS